MRIEPRHVEAEMRKDKDILLTTIGDLRILSSHNLRFRSNRS